MFKPFRTAAVLGAGVMGSQIAAHLANVGLTVHLLDIPAPSGNKNHLVEAAFKKALKLSPPIFFTSQTAQRVILGNYEEHWSRIAQVDWVIEAVVENLAIKQDLLARIEAIIAPGTIVSTNTSGLSIQAIATGRSAPFRQHFLGTHFFNPPRYLKLLEIIPTPDTDPLVVERLQWFSRLYLGKGVVIAKDTPNFIANRIGVLVTMLGLQAVTKQGYTLAEIDRLTGSLVGRPKSGTFRTIDLVGLDILVQVADHLYQAVEQDECRDLFQVPEVLRQLVATGTLGTKTGQGFYKKVSGEIHALNLQTLTYEPMRPPQLENLAEIESITSLPERLRALYGQVGRAGDFFRQMIRTTLAYSANRIPEIADSPVALDRAMRWGFGWELGPFEIWDALGWEQLRHDIEQAGLPLPAWITAMMTVDFARFYTPLSQSYHPQHGYLALPQPQDELHLDQLDSSAILWQNEQAVLWDVGDRVALYEFRSKANTLSALVIQGLVEVLDWLENHDYRGLVIGNEGTNFCVGINLAEVGQMVADQVSPTIDPGHPAVAQLLRQFQTLVQRIHYFHKPIVAAIQGRVLGGGCELAMACPQVVADAETYIGLVELGVGLIPAGGGLMRMARWINRRAATASLGDSLPFLKQVFTTIGMAKVATSADEGQELGFVPPTAQVMMNSDRRLAVAKQTVLYLDRIGYRPPPRQPIYVLGATGRAALQHMAYILQQGGYISDYDRQLADHLATVLTGGELTDPTWVDEDYLLQLERDRFLPLLNQAKTQQRILHMLQTKKPLRN